MPSSISQARELGRQHGTFNPAQYVNHDNPAAATKWIGPELWKQTRGNMTVFAAGLGTSGTLVGTAQFLRKQGAGVCTVGVICEPNQFVPGVRSERRLEEVGFDWRVAADHLIEVDAAASFEQSVQLCRSGVLAGPSSGFALAGLLRFLGTRKASFELDQLRNRNGDVLAVFTCGDTPLPYLDQYAPFLDSPAS